MNIHDYQWATEELALYRGRPPYEQVANKANLLRAFKVVWSAGLTPEEFAALTSGLTIFPELFYIITGRA